MVVEPGNNIRVEYEGRLLTGEIFDSSKKHGQPLAFVAGKGMVVKGFDDAVLGLDVGQETEVTVKPEEGYGNSDPRAIQKVPRRMFPQEAQEGMQIGIPLPDGQVYPATITQMTDTEVTVDMNHPLAGKTMIFKIKIVSIEK